MKKKPLLIAVILLAALLAIYVGITLAGKSSEKKAAEKKEAETDYLLSDAHEGEVEFTALSYTDGTDTMSFESEGDETWYNADDKEMDMESSKIQRVAEDIRDLAADRKLEDPDALSDYGFDTPSYTITCTYDGTEHTILLGSAVDDDYYATVDDAGDVYTVSSTLISDLYFSLDDLVNTESVPSISSGNIKEVDVTEDGKTTTYTEDTDLEELAGGWGVLSFDTFADYHVTDDELKSYGLNEKSRMTATVKYEDSSSGETEEYTIYIGKSVKDADDETVTNRYVQVKDTNKVFLISDSVIGNLTTVEETTETDDSSSN